MTPEEIEELLRKNAELEAENARLKAGGHGAVAGDGGVAVGHDVHGDLTVTNQPRTTGEVLRAYRNHIAQSCRSLSLQGLDEKASDVSSKQRPASLEKVYVALDTTHRSSGSAFRKGTAAGIDKPKERAGEEDDSPVSALKAVATFRQAVVLGEQGSGKSTFLNYLALSLARNGLADKAVGGARFAGWPEADAELLPVRVTLRDFAKWQAARRDEEPTGFAGGEEGLLLWDFISEQLSRRKLDYALVELEKALQAGRAIVMLDGLDEASTSDQRVAVCGAIHALRNHFEKSRFVVTCRTLSYQNERWKLDGFEEAELAAFSVEKIDAFVEAWYADSVDRGIVETEEREDYADSLKRATRRVDLTKFAANPLLLTVMALVNTHDGKLPDTRTLLYEKTVAMLMLRWDQRKEGGEHSSSPMKRLLDRAALNEVDLRRALWSLAFEAHARGGFNPDEGIADIGESVLLDSLEALNPGERVWAQELLETIKARAGLLLERGKDEAERDTYGFPHRTFQEYLAGAHLASLESFAAECVRRFDKDPDSWRVVILLAAGKLVYLDGQVDKALGMVAAFCPADAEADDAAWLRVWMAGEALVEIGANRAGKSPFGGELLKRVRTKLAALLTQGALSARQRGDAGDALAALDDPRPGVGVQPSDDGVRLPDINWIQVPGGVFPMGNDTPESEYDNEKPRFDCDLIGKEGFQIARYLVTVAQYRCFVDAGGYKEALRRHWTDAGWEWKSSNGISGPETYDEEAYQRLNHPQAGVSWYEATAFCAWLSEVLGRTIRLPSEPEWERAARHTDTRLYPWGSDEDFGNRANINGVGASHTSPVGMFPKGAAECGALDMSGNVLEWCCTKWADSYKNYKPDDDSESDAARVLRGGAWYVGPDDARCAVRNWVNPYYRYDDVGFRVVSSPF